MLLEFSCANHKSIRDEVLFSVVAGTDTAHAEHCLTVGRLNVLRSAVIYGPNGSGKSNLLDAIAAVRGWVGGEPVIQTPHKLAEGQTSSYDAQFLVGGTRYAYGLCLRGGVVDEEYLYAFPRDRRVMLFERASSAVTPGDRFGAKIAALAGGLPADRLLLALPQADAIPPLAEARRFFTETLVPYRLDDRQPDDDQLDAALAILREDAETRAAVCTILGMLGTGIRDIRAEGDEAVCVYAGFETDLRREESTGIRRLVGFLCPLVDMLRDERVLLCDEPEANLHETVIHALLDTLRHTRPDSRAQLIFATHSTALLDLDLFRRDQIWFTELRPADRSTELYSLAEIRDVRRDENIRQGYLTGKYGGIPMLDHDFARLFGSEEVSADG